MIKYKTLTTAYIAIYVMRHPKTNHGSSLYTNHTTSLYVVFQTLAKVRVDLYVVICTQTLTTVRVCT